MPILSIKIHMYLFVKLSKECQHFDKIGFNLQGIACSFTKKNHSGTGLDIRILFIEIFYHTILKIILN